MVTKILLKTAYTELCPISSELASRVFTTSTQQKKWAKDLVLYNSSTFPKGLQPLISELGLCGLQKAPYV